MTLITRLARTFLSGSYKGHFGQWAEDVLVRKLFPRKKTSGIYLDIGAHHPFRGSNTAYLWLKGWRGFNIDANPQTIKLFNQVRPSDKNIWTAVISQMEYFNGVREVDLMLPNCDGDVSAIGTCSTAVGLERGFNKRLKVPAKSISQVMIDYNIHEFDYLNIDVEGYDEEIIRDFDFSIIRPKVITIEDYSENIKKVLLSNISTVLFSKGYDLVGRAGPTSIFHL